MKYQDDERIVLTLDAGGTNFVYSAIRGYESITEPIRYPAQPDNLEKCLENIVQGFSQLQEQIDQEPAAISFAFPGPTDYRKGIIGDLHNLPAFRGGIPLGPYLEKEFDLPVYINNDGNLYAYGEALVGYLPDINKKLKEAGSPKQFRNLVGFTLGTGFGAGIVHNGELIIGDNSNAAEVWIIRDVLNPERNVEENISIRAVQREYANKTKSAEKLSPKEIYTIAIGEKKGDRKAATEAFQRMGRSLGEVASIVATLIDGIIVIGGGVAGASSIILPSVLEVMNGSFDSNNGANLPRLVTKNYNLEDNEQFSDFIQGKSKVINIPGHKSRLEYDPEKRIGVGVSKIGTSQAVSAGAYAFALNQLDKK
jgi:glucokinase